MLPLISGERKLYKVLKRSKENYLIAISFTGIILLSILMIWSLAYRRKERRMLDKKAQKMWFVYGLAMFLVDKFLQKAVKGNQKVNMAMRNLVVKENIEKEKYTYIVNKVVVCISAIWITLFLTLAVSISEKSESKEIFSLFRNTRVDTEYNLQIENTVGKKEQVTIHVAKKQYTEKQIREIFDKRKDELIKKVLGNNQSQDKVNQSLHLVTEIGKEKISVSWSIQDSSKIDYDGTLSKEIADEGEIVMLTATMSLGKVSEEYSFAVNVYPPVESGSLGEKLQEYVDENKKYDQKVKLPKEIDGEDVKYKNIDSNTSGFILLIGLSVAIVLFFLKDSDLKKEVNKRNRQLKNDYPEIVSKILLYYGAGLSMKGTIERIVKGYEEEKKGNRKLYRYAYEELEMCLVKMKSGVSEMSAINRYGERCNLHCYVKLAGLIEQNMRRGTKELSLVLKSELREAMNEKKNNMLRNGGQISTKLLGPMIIMLIISMVIIMVPAFMSMGV